MDATSSVQSSPNPPGEGSLHQAANSIRFNLNWQWTAIKLQHDRLTDSSISPNDTVEVSMRNHMNGIVDMDFLVIAVRRLLRVAEQAKKSGCDVNKKVKPAIKEFETHWGHIIGARNSLEHVGGHGTFLLPMSSSSGDWQFGMPGNSIKMHELFRDAQILARVISKVIEPYEPQQAVP
jgi:hypothetical protein